MQTVISHWAAWITVLFTIFLLAKFILKRLSNRNSKSNLLLTALNRKLIKSHIFIGILVVFTGFIHGLLSGKSIISFNFGSILLIIYALMVISYYLRRKLKNWLSIHRTLSIVVIAMFFLHINEVGGVTVFDKPSGYNDPFEYTIKNTDITSGFEAIFADGIYSGTADGYGSNLTVEIEIKEGVIQRIKIISHNEEDSKFYIPAFENIPERIMKSQSLNVDAVSGATFSSTGILNAVRDALSKAVITGTLPDTIPLPR